MSHPQAIRKRSAMIRGKLCKFSLYPIRLISSHTTYDRRHGATRVAEESLFLVMQSHDGQ